MDKLGIMCARRAGKVLLVDQSDIQSAQRRISGDAGPNHAAANDEEVECCVGETGRVTMHGTSRPSQERSCSRMQSLS